MCPLLACSPMEAIADFSAAAHVEFIGSTLNFYGKEVTDLEFFTADNSSVNVATARDCNVPLVGCASHRLALATREVILQGGYQPLIDEVSILINKLTTLINAAKLRNCVLTKGRVSITRNTTRWTSDWKMLTRFVFLYPFLYTLELSRETLVLIPNPDGFEQCKQLLIILKHFYDA